MVLAVAYLVCRLSGCTPQNHILFLSSYKPMSTIHINYISYFCKSKYFCDNIFAKSFQHANLRYCIIFICHTMCLDVHKCSFIMIGVYISLYRALYILLYCNMMSSWNFATEKYSNIYSLPYFCSTFGRIATLVEIQSRPRSSLYSQMSHWWLLQFRGGSVD